MRAMVLKKVGGPLVLEERAKPKPGPGQLLVRVAACGVCRTDLHIVDGEMNGVHLPLIPGHQVVGEVEEIGPGAPGFEVGEHVGLGWLGSACGKCVQCLGGRENLCAKAVYTGYQTDGGYADYCLADHRFSFSLPPFYKNEQAAPLFCAGVIGYRALGFAGPAEKIGFYGFGSAAHLLTQVAAQEGRKVHAFTRPGDQKTQDFARELGAVWAGGVADLPPVPLDAAIIFAPDGKLVPLALKAVAPGGRVVCAGIHMSDIPSFPYTLLWGERSLCSVANLTRVDAQEFLNVARHVPLRTVVKPYALEKANEALADLRQGAFNGSAVLVMR